MINKCNSRFRWVALQLNELKQCKTKNDLQNHLSTLPGGLWATYDQILLSIKEQDQSYVKLFLQWLSFAVRPLRLTELAASTTVDLSAENGPEYKSDNELQDINDILKVCSGFVVESKGIIHNNTRMNEC